MSDVKSNKYAFFKRVGTAATGVPASFAHPPPPQPEIESPPNENTFSFHTQSGLPPPDLAPSSFSPDRPSVPPSMFSTPGSAADLTRHRYEADQPPIGNARPIPVSIPARAHTQSVGDAERSLRRRVASPMAMGDSLAPPAAEVAAVSDAGAHHTQPPSASQPRKSTSAVATPGGNNVVFSLSSGKSSDWSNLNGSPKESPTNGASDSLSGGLVGSNYASVQPVQNAQLSQPLFNPFESHSHPKLRGKRKFSDPDLRSSSASKPRQAATCGSRLRTLVRIALSPITMLINKVRPDTKKDDDAAAGNFSSHKFRGPNETRPPSDSKVCSVKNILFFIIMTIAVATFYIWYTHECVDEVDDLDSSLGVSVLSSSGDGGHLHPGLVEPLNPASSPGGIVATYLGNSLQEFEMMYPFLHPVLHFFKRPVDHSTHNHDKSQKQPNIPFTLVSLLRDMTPEFLDENKASYIFQYNALLSWLRLTPHVLVYMDTAESCRDLTSRPEFASVRCFPVPCMHDTVHRPLLNCIFEHSHKESTTEAMGFVNGDIILSPKVKNLVNKIGNEFSKYLVVSRRTDTQIPEYLIDAYIANYHNRVIADVRGVPFVPATGVDPATGQSHVIADNVDSAVKFSAEAGVLHSEFGIDLFLYPKSTFEWMFPAFPPFLAGVYRWDNYFLTKMILHPDVSTIDASQFGLLVHQQTDGGKDHSKRSGAPINDALVKQHLGSVYKLGHIKNVDYVLSGACPEQCDLAPNPDASVHVLYAKRANKQNWMSVIQVNSNEQIELNNFICWSNRVNFRNFLFLTRDSDMYEELMRRDMPVIYLDRSLVDAVHSTPRGSSALPINPDAETAASILQRNDFLMSVLKAGYHFLYTSVRAIYLDDPLRVLSNPVDGELNDVTVVGNASHIVSAPYHGPLAVRSSTYGQYFWKQVHDCADMNKHIADPSQWIDCVQHNWRVLKGGVKKGFFDEMKFTDAKAFFKEKTPLTHGFYPIMIFDESVSTNTEKFNRLKQWGLMATKASSPICLDDQPSHRATLFKPPTSAPSTDFRLKVRVLTFNRHASLQRLLTILQTANYDNDRVDLEISIDYPLNMTDAPVIEEWKTTQLVARSFAWKHGNIEVIQQPVHIGLTGQWTQGWYPPDDNKEVMLFLEDDTGVSPFYYTFVKKMILTYYLNPNNYDPSLYGFALQTQHTILGETMQNMYGTRKVPDLLNATAVSRGDPDSTLYFRYQLVGTWGGVFFPQHWREFLIWLREKQFIHAQGVSPIFEPCVPTMVSNAWWMKKPHKVWSQWFVRFAFEKGWYNMYTNYPDQLSLVGNFREGGENFAVTKGLMNEMVDEFNSPPGSKLYTHLHAEELPLPVSSIPLYDLHFNEIDNAEVLKSRLKVWGNKDNIPQCLTIAELKKQQKEIANKLKAKLEHQRKQAELRAKESQEDTSILASFAALESTMHALNKKGVAAPPAAATAKPPSAAADAAKKAADAKKAAAVAAAKKKKDEEMAAMGIETQTPPQTESSEETTIAAPAEDVTSE